MAGWWLSDLQAACFRDCTPSQHPRLRLSDLATLQAVDATVLHCIARRYKAADSGSARSEVQRWDRRTGLSANLAEDGGFTKAEAEAIVDTAGEVVFLDDRGRFGDDDEDGDDDDDDDRAASTGDLPRPV